MSSGNAPSRLANVNMPPIRTKRPIIRAMIASQASAAGKPAGAPPQAAEIQNTQCESGAQMGSETEKHGPSRQHIERRNAHAFFIHFQADQHPSASPSIRSGAVQKSPELNF